MASDSDGSDVGSHDVWMQSGCSRESFEEVIESAFVLFEITWCDICIIDTTIGAPVHVVAVAVKPHSRLTCSFWLRTVRGSFRIPATSKQFIRL